MSVQERNNGGQSKAKADEPVSAIALAVAMSQYFKLPNVWPGVPPDMLNELTDPVTGTMWAASCDYRERCVLLRKIEHPTDPARKAVTNYRLDQDWFKSDHRVMPEIKYGKKGWAKA